MDLATFQKNFPPGAAVPEILRDWLAFQNEAADWYSGHVELAEWPFGQAAWFDGDADAARRFVVLGQDADGSLYALWLYDGRTVDDAPVVFLGSEGTECGLLAGDLREFAALSAVGADELGFAVSRGEVAEADPPAPRLAAFRDRLRANFGPVPPSDPMAAVASARGRHPDFNAWLDAWFAAHFKL